MQSFLDYFSSNRDRFITEWRELLAFKSISADPAFHNDCLECAAWLSRHLEGLGFKTEIWPSDTKPLIYGVLPGNPTRPVILFYGHYDVQPVDPLNLWITPPFEPTLRDGRMYARGAQDNKGQLFYFLKALEALKVTGADLPTIKVIIEGEEECGSEAMHAGLAQWKEPLKSDILMVCDTGVIAAGVPTITMGLRGIAHCELRVHGPRIDLHSGVYGGVVLNPLQALSSILAGLHAPDGSVAVPGFYNGVKAPHAEDRELAAKAPIDTDAISAMLGVSLEGGEHGLHPLERRGFRPTLEINGVGGGYQGAGGKTVIPAYGMAKLSMRLVDGQDPDEILSAVVRHLQGAAPKGTCLFCHPGWDHRRSLGEPLAARPAQGRCDPRPRGHLQGSGGRAHRKRLPAAGHEHSGERAALSDPRGRLAGRAGGGRRQLSFFRANGGIRSGAAIPAADFHRGS